MRTPPPDVPVSCPWSATRAVTPGSSRMVLVPVEAAHPLARVNIRCVTPLGEEVASIS
jgi:hypothetical protein